MHVNEPQQSNNRHQHDHLKPDILAQNPSYKERKLRLRWFIAISTLPLFGIYAAFGLAPQTTLQDIQTATVIETVTLPNAPQQASLSAESQAFWQTDQVRRDDTLTSLLARLNIRNQEAIDFLQSNAEASALASQLRPGHAIQAQTNQSGELLSLSYQIDSNTSLRITRTVSGYQAETGTPVLETHQELKSTEIESSLFASTDAAGIPDQIAIQLADIFSSEIDFNSDLRQGDRLAVVYETNYQNGEAVKTGQVLAAEFTNQGKTYRAVMYRTPQGQVSYYSADGKSLHKSFLRSPLEFTRISSGFSLSRFHPILQTMRAHKGVDYAAPIGTRVKAAGDATVAFVGVKGGYGNMIMLNHQGNIRTVYGHLSRFAEGLHKGMKVAQGDIIGYVGMTGLATGPHLHYEFLLNGEQHDPLKVALPVAMPIAARYQADFAATSAALMAQIKLLKASSLASLD